MKSLTLTQEQRIEEAFNIEECDLREIYTDFNGCTEVTIELEELYIVTVVTVQAFGFSRELEGMDYEIAILDVDVLEAWWDGEPINRKEVEQIINRK
jgi:hypothetical protein